ncbi:hypothetical protein CAPTEDRAFT_163497 [Capitella teleta]|uniref:Alpha-ketoglutarate-dependent dioxygenase AlkB-like domain-containing protein n=1 Tax=Capitella teleta TaxID=283909 RepID=R7VK25_CAPTE|nr:hypothetical protein CAPTEDRAFT_163497 [Capitella teleta]|eukprot:ELU16415.1 hypothetical protein CAPTEDRAFT_163497 [Capitella teleta]
MGLLRFLSIPRHLGSLPIRLFTQSSLRSCPTLQTSNGLKPCETCITASDRATEEDIRGSFFVYKDFISEEEEQSLFDEVEPYLKRLHYEQDHWDDAIHGYRETERQQWTKKNRGIIQRVRDLAFPPGVPQLSYVHVLDLQKTGCVKAHIDSIKFCGSTIAGLSLLSNSVMRLVHDKTKSRVADIYAERRALYIMTGSSRYDYTHEILGESESFFEGKAVERDRRISIVCRNKP